jgi:RNA polymerase sigma-B factor
MTGDQPPAVAGRQRMIEQHLPLARSLARRYRLGGEPIEDLEQTAYVGLVKAVDRFDPGRGAFPAFAIPTILGELRRHFRDRGWAVKVPRRIQEASLAVEQETEALNAVLRRAPTAAEIAERTGLAVEDVLEAHHAAGAHRSLSLVSGGGEDDAPGAATDVGALDDGYARAEERATIVTMLGSLKPYEREIVMLRFHDELSQREIAQRVGVSQMSVSRALRRSLDRMRTAAESYTTGSPGSALGRDQLTTPSGEGKHEPK